MLMRTCTKEKPTWVLQRLAGKWWNFGRVLFIVYTGFGPVSNAFCPVFVASCLPLFLLFCLLSWPCRLTPCFWTHTSPNATQRVLPRTEWTDQALSPVVQLLSCLSTAPLSI